jgi:plastocyanin
MLIVAIPAIVIAYTAMKMPQYAKPIGMIFVIATGAAIAAYIGFGVYGPSQYLVPPPVEVEEEKPAAPALTAPVTTISILKGSSVQGSPDYDPDLAQVPAGNNIEWVNNDEIVHTATSSDGKSFDTSIIKPGENYVLDASKLQPGTYDYICIVHPYMTSTLVYGESGQRLTEDATVTDPNSIPPTEVPIEEVPVETPVEVPVETPVEEIPVEEAPIEEIPVETPIEEMPAGTSEETAIPATEVTVDMAVGTGSNTECGDQCFIPNVVKVSKGGKIIWTNSDSMIHTATASDQSFDTGFVSGGASSELTFENPGTYDYICQVHPWMKGQIIVE